MHANLQRAEKTEHTEDGLAHILTGYRFRVCEDAASFEAALDVRRRVYQGSCGYEVPVPDPFDGRSFLLIAEDVETGEAVGTMRITPRFAGRFEAEDFFDLALHLRSRVCVEVNRFAILPAHRKNGNGMPAVSFGLFKLMIRFVMKLGMKFVVVAAKPDRAFTYEWLRFKRTGMKGSYGALDGAEHEVLYMDLRDQLHGHTDHQLYTYFFGMEHAEVRVPTATPLLRCQSRGVAEPNVFARTA